MVLFPVVPAVTIERVEFAPFGECVRMTNGEADVLISPRTGRIVFYGRTGGRNVLWINPQSPKGKPGEWANWGGDKLWPAPQAEWNWPPDPAIDGQPHRVRVVRGDTVEMTSPVSPKTGFRMVRTIRLNPLGTEVVLVNRLQNRGRRARWAAVWQIAQVIPGTVRMPATGFRPYDGTVVELPWARVLGDVVEVTRDPKGGRKYGAKGVSGKLEWEEDGLRFVMEHRLRPGMYPDDDRAQQVYTSADPTAYIELELTAPLEDLRPGGESVLETLWTLEGARD